MRLLLDECIPRRLKRDLPGHDVVTVSEAGWSGKKNGALLALAAAEFDAFLTLDQNLEYQQNLSGFELGVLILSVPNNRLESIRPFAPEILTSLGTIKPGVQIRLGNPLNR